MHTKSKKMWINYKNPSCC